MRSEEETGAGGMDDGGVGIITLSDTAVQALRSSRSSLAQIFASC